MSGIIVDILSALPGERRMDELYAQAYSDAERGRPVASEHPLYGSHYHSVAQLMEVRAGRLILIIEWAEACPRCRYVDMGRMHFGCHCGAHPFTRVPGAMALYGPISDDLMPEFVPCEQLRNLVLTGLRAQSMDGVDLTAQINAIQ